MSFVTPGLHHVTAIATRPQGNIEFYVRLLGLRLLKRTVNYDDPQTYHFYFGDALGRPGSVLTFFPWPGTGPATRGAGEASAVAFRVPPDALPLWRDRLDQHRLEHASFERFGEEVLAFADPDGTPLELVEGPLRGSSPETWPGAPLPAVMAPQSLHAATVAAPKAQATSELLQEVFGMQLVGEDDGRLRLAAGNGAEGSYLDLVKVPAALPGRWGAGSIHHLAMRAGDEGELAAARAALEEHGLKPTAVKNRLYFKSVYFEEPGGAIFEVATDAPGFTVDEPADELGLGFKLPEWLETEREFLRGRLPVTASPEYADRFNPG